MPIVRPLVASQSTATKPLGSDDPHIPELQPRFPQWVADALGSSLELSDVGPHMRASRIGPTVAIEVTVPLAVLMPAGELRTEVSRAYRHLRGWLSSRGRAPIRFWNYIPAIDEAMGDGLDRYMVFNSGRYEAFDRGPDGDTPSLERTMAAASAVGITGCDLVIHGVAADESGIPVENPRQTSSWRYSRRFGPMPPCFARAVVSTVSGRPTLLIAGTASIVGEESLHPGDPVEQLDETLRNLRAILRAAPAASPVAGQDPLARLQHLRVYVTSVDLAVQVRRRLRACCPDVLDLEVVLARICRPELLVEIEGVAIL